jgi:hypothetical protein
MDALRICIYGGQPCLHNGFTGLPVKRQRRTAAELEAVNRAIVQAVDEDAPVTLRGVFYRVVSMGAIPKTENGYGCVQRQLLALRRAGVVPYDSITDGTRWRRRPVTWDSLEQMLDDAAISYRRSLWHDQPVYVEILSEKDAITGTIRPVTNRYDIPLGIVRGYSSETFIWEMARDVHWNIAEGKLVYIYQLGDHDPSGVDAWRAFQERVREFLDDWNCGGYPTFQRLAVTPAQIREMSLPTRPTKQNDTRAARFHGGSVEVDAIPAPTLRRIVEDAITQHIDPVALEMTRMAERSERETLTRMRSMME